MHKKLSLAFSLIIIIGCGGGGGGSNVNNAPAVSVAPTPTAPTSNLSFDELKEQFEATMNTQINGGYLQLMLPQHMQGAQLVKILQLELPTRV